MGVFHNSRKIKQSSLQRAGCLLLASGLLHLALGGGLWWLGHTTQVRAVRTVIDNRYQIRILSPVSRKPQPRLARVKSAHLQPAKPRKTPARQQTAMSHQIPREPSAAPLPAQRSGRRYADLLPQPGFDSPLPAPKNAGGGRRLGIDNFDAENDAIPYATRVKHLAKIMAFAQDLSDQIAVPAALRKLQPHGAAHLRFSRQEKSQWTIAQADGDPYFRALLYESVSRLGNDSVGLQKLSASEFDSIRIVFVYQTKYALDPTVKPVEISVDGNKIFLTFTDLTVDPKWQMLAVTPTGLPAINLIGVGMVLARPFIEKDPLVDIDIQKLRLSPAFIRPVGH